mmetsp:Transcript_15200/g.43459  ORF Transcript_15200/g.43459 Transcript_15200/m.43459 type:complete len:380 (-) Transcript_15200:143-1282(-)
MAVWALLLGMPLLHVVAGLRLGRVSPEEDEFVLPHAGPSAYDAWRLWPPNSMPGRPVREIGAEYFVPSDDNSTGASQRASANMQTHGCVANATELGSGWRRSYGYMVGNVTEPTLTPFVVPISHPNRTDAAVVVVPSGGEAEVSWETEGVDAARWLNSLGVSAFLLKYRTPGGAWAAWAQLMDTQEAIKMVRAKADSLHLNASRVGLFAASSGGKLALLASAAKVQFSALGEAYDASQLRPNFNILLYPAFPAEVVTKEFAPMYDMSLVPLTMIIAAADDKCVTFDKMLVLHQLLHPGRNLTQLAMYPRGGHGFGLCHRQGKRFMQTNEVCMWTEPAESFIRNYVLNQPKEGLLDPDGFFDKMRKLIGAPDIDLDLVIH